MGTACTKVNNSGQSKPALAHMASRHVSRILPNATQTGEDQTSGSAIQYGEGWHDCSPGNKGQTRRSKLRKYTL